MINSEVMPDSIFACIDLLEKEYSIKHEGATSESFIETFKLDIVVEINEQYGTIFTECDMEYRPNYTGIPLQGVLLSNFR